MIELYLSHQPLFYYIRGDFMAYYQNHLVDPLWFLDAVEEFAFDYDWYIRSEVHLNALGMQTAKFEK